MYPFSLWLLMFIGVIGYGSVTRYNFVRVSSDFSYTRNVPNPLLFWITTILIALFAGNIIANDVYIYRINYANLYSDTEWTYIWRGALGDNPLFTAVQYFCRNVLMIDSANFQMLWIGIAQILFLLTYRRYSVSLPLTILMVISSGLFLFTSVSWKQSMAMSIGFAATPLAFERRWVAYYGTLLVTMLIHPYIIMFGMLPLFVSKKIWTRKSIFILVVMLGAGMMLSSIMGTALDVTQNIVGDQYSAELFTNDYGVKPERVIFYAICPALAILYRKRLDAVANSQMNAFMQMSVISFGFMAMSLGGGANFISRMGNYFEPFTYVALPYILLKTVPSNSRTVMLIGVVSLYLVFFAFLQLKRGSLL